MDIRPLEADACSRLREATARLQDSGTTGSSFFSFLRHRGWETAHVCPPGAVDFHQASPCRGSPATRAGAAERTSLSLPCLVLAACVLPRFFPRPGAWHPGLARTDSSFSLLQMLSPRSGQHRGPRAPPPPASPPLLSAGSQPHRPAPLQPPLAAPPDGDSQQSPAAGHHSLFPV